jgi:hypothetical protein
MDIPLELIDSPGMNDDEIYRCRVCGLWSDDPPWGLDGQSPARIICDCCGTDSGYEDDSVESARAYRAAWLAKGAKWMFPKRKPVDWDLAEQLTHVPTEFQ